MRRTPIQDQLVVHSQPMVTPTGDRTVVFAAPMAAASAKFTAVRRSSPALPRREPLVEGTTPWVRQTATPQFDASHHQFLEPASGAYAPPAPTRSSESRTQRSQ